jgi:phage gpG-like protein
MPVVIDLKNTSGIQAMQRLLSAQEKLTADLMLRLGKQAQAEIKHQIDTWVSSTQPRLSTGELAKSFYLEKLSVSGNVGRIRISSDSPYAAIHNYGGIIQGKIMAVPGNRALRFFTGRKAKKPITQKDLTNQNKFIITRAEIRAKKYLFSAQHNLRSQLPSQAQTALKTEWGTTYMRTP